MKRILLTVILLVCGAGMLFAQEPRPLPAFTADDRVLVLAPHPDDEAIGTAGVIMRALAAGARVKVACFTNGEHNEVSFILYEKRLTLRKNGFLYMGQVRRKESLAGLAVLGVKPEDVVYFGYPDFGTLSIMLKYWGEGTRPYKSILTRIDSVSYEDAISPGSLYKGESILDDMRGLLEDFRPTKVFVSHPADTNMDHQAFYLFLKVALWDLEGRISPEVYPYIIHVVGWPAPRGYHPALPLKPPPENIFDVSWYGLTLTPEEIEKKREMISCYKSQLAYAPSYLYTFARKNELFGDCPEVRLEESPGDLYAWHNVSPGETQTRGKGTADNQVSRLSFSRKEGSLYIKIVLKKAMDKNLGVRVLLLPYSRHTAFSAMPKLNITIGIRGMQIRDRLRIVELRGCRYSVRGRIIVVQVPLREMGDPDRILSKIWARFSRDFPFRAPAWRVIELDG